MSKHTVRRSDPARRFVTLPQTQIPRSVFDRSHGWKGTLDDGYLVPFFVDEVLPGDTFKLHTHLLARMATPLVPIMDNIWLRTEYFFVPNRLVWDHWEAMNGDQESGPSASTDYTVPSRSIASLGAETIGDYMGLPTGVNNSTDTVNELPLRAYALIWDEWYRDENLQDAYCIDPGTNRFYKDDAILSSDVATNPLTYNSRPLKRAKFHDYFTSALPWPQKGQQVDINLAGYAPVITSSHTNNVPVSIDTSNFASYQLPGDSSLYRGITNVQDLDGNYLVEGLGTPVSSDPHTYAVALLGETSSISINDLRQAFQIQKLYERDARGGTRYTEILRSHFGVISPDARLQRPEYLGGGRTRININSVAQNSATDGTTPQGNLAAFGIGLGSSHSFTKSFVEHGFIIGLVSIQADLTYQQGLNRMWSRKTRFDHYWPVFAHLGEQAILNKEIYFGTNTAENNATFGFQERFAEYRYFPSQITGKMRSTYAQPLDMWHLGQKFDALPTLSSDFIQENAPISRALAVTNEPQFILDAWFDMKCTRPMPLYSVPGLVDHF